MEQKILKTNVTCNETVFNESTEQPIDVDFTLPDYCPDISQIFKCRAVSRVSSKSISGRNITVDGSVCITILYSDRESNLCSYEYQYPFSKNVEMKEECTGADLSCRSKCEYINCRAVTGRKVDIHGAIGIYIKAFKRKSTEIIADIDDPVIEQKRGTAPATTPMGYAEKYLILEEELPIGQGQPAVQSILRYDAKTCVRECKLVNGKIVVKGEMSVCVLYCPEDGGMPQSVKTVIPFSQIVDMEGVTDECECDCKSELAFLEIKPHGSAAGDVRGFSLTAKLLLVCEAFCGSEIPVLLDAFSRKYQANIVKNPIRFERITEKISETYHCKKNLEIEDTLVTILDLWCDIQSVATKFEENNMTVTGTLIVGMIACDTEQTPGYFEKAIDFDYHYPLKNGMEHLRCTPELEVLSTGYTITGNSQMELRVDMGINAAIYESVVMPLITDFHIEEGRLAERPDKGAMMICFAAPGEEIWDVALRYHASVEEIMKINGLSNEPLSEGRMILVPMV